jgi:hypothetical protein
MTGMGRRRRGGINDHGAAVLEESIGDGTKEEDGESEEMDAVARDVCASNRGFFLVGTQKIVPEPT